MIMPMVNKAATVPKIALLGQVCGDPDEKNAQARTLFRELAALIFQ